MFKKQYLYAISYMSTDEKGRNGNGCVQILRKQKINSLFEFNKVLLEIKKNNNLREVVIFNIMLLGKVKEK